jgi:hypothetical protein
VTEADSYDGSQAENSNTLVVSIKKGWTLTLVYVAKNSAYVLGNISLAYTVDKETFPNAVNEGKNLTAEVAGLNEFSANKGNSYKCYSQTNLIVNEVDLIFKNYQAEPFLDGKSKDFDTGTFISKYSWIVFL